MKRILKRGLMSMSLFAMVAFSAMPVAAHSLEGSVQAGQGTAAATAIGEVHFVRTPAAPVPTNSVLRKLAPSSVVQRGHFLNGRTRP